MLRRTTSAPVGQVRRQLLDGALEDRHRRVQELVDRRADDDDHLLHVAQQLRLGADGQATGGQHLGQELIGAVLEKRHLAAGDALHGGLEVS